MKRKPSRLIYVQRIFLSDFLKLEKTAEFSGKITKKLKKKNINHLICTFFFEAIQTSNRELHFSIMTIVLQKSST